MDKSTHEVRMEQWRAIALQCQARPERQTAASWLAENGVNAKQYYYWLRQIRREAYDYSGSPSSAITSSRMGRSGMPQCTFPRSPANRSRLTGRAIRLRSLIVVDIIE